MTRTVPFAGPEAVGQRNQAFAVEVKGLMRSYGPKPVLRGVGLRLRHGATLALLGPNGAGKTTLLRVLATLARPDAGTVRLAGRDVTLDGDAVRRIVGYVGHQPHLYEELTALENLVFFARMHRLADPTTRAHELLARVGLAARAGDRARALSRGQAQRLSLARALLHQPAVLLLDEPETGLDESAITLLDAILTERAAAGQTTIFTTHHLERAIVRASAVAILARGRIVHEAETHGLGVGELRAAYEQYAGGGR
ncbi:MAG TPA: heme ABC exporter ATP-binding protein CcmA [Ktedonobacterales bacterium]|nr:heme ABC exporter ATP-binding protein CcmA [Ktedonobacterales bacterium]